MTEEDGGRATRRGRASSAKNGSGSLREAFPGFYRPTDDEFGRLWDEGTFVFDTNVLLNLYRYSGSTRGQLLGVLGALSERLFLPHQVGREFLDNRLRTIQKQRQGFGGLREAAEGAAEAADSGLRSVLRLRPKEDLPRGLRDALEGVRKGYEELIERLGELERGVPRASNSPEDDEVWAAIDGLFEGKVGPPYGEEEAKEAEEEAARRKNAKLPPGFKDDGPGDYLVWRQTVDEAKRSGRPVVLVTDDRKEDW